MREEQTTDTCPPPPHTYIQSLATIAGEIVVRSIRASETPKWQDENPVATANAEIDLLFATCVAQDFETFVVIKEVGEHDVTEFDDVILFAPFGDSAGTEESFGDVLTSSFCVTHVQRGIAQSACLYDPFQDRMYTAKRGEGARLNGKRVRLAGIFVSSEHPWATTALRLLIEEAGVKLAGN